LLWALCLRASYVVSYNGGTQYSFFMSQGELFYKRADCVKTLHSSRDENTPISSMKSASAGVYKEAVISPQLANSVESERP
jgi:hypothetical protein